MRLLTCLTLLLTAGLAAAAPRTAAQAEAEIERMLEDARSFYDNLELDQAESSLDRAIRLAERFSVTTAAVAQVYMQRGILSHVRDKDEEAAVNDFIEALRIDPRSSLDPLVSTPSLEALFDRARRGGGGGARRPPRGGDEEEPPVERRPPPPPREPDVRHTPPRQVEAGRPVTLSFELSDALNRDVYRAYLHYRTARADEVQKVELEPAGRSTFTGKIPGRFIAGRTLTYHVVFEDRGGSPIGAVQSARDPVQVPVKGDTLGDLDEIPSGSGLGDGGDDDGTRKYVSLSVALGTGGGFITDLAQPQNQKSANIRPGFALAPFHALIEADFWIIERLALGAFARVQIIEFTHMEGGRLKFKAITGEHQLVLRAGGGFGQVRHLVQLEDNLLDTTLEGPYLYTVGASYVYEFNPTVGLHVTPDFIHLIGASPSLHIDFNIGVRASF